MSNSVRILLLADTHLGFDYPFRPRIERRRRGDDFFANFDRALRPAMEGEVDLVVHGGDLLFRTRIHDALLQLAMEPLLKVADRGIPVYLVPGNHERSRIPLQIWTVHPNLHIFHKPQTFTSEAGGLTVALSGFPFARKVRDRFGDLVDSTDCKDIEADVFLLCIHQAVEGAVVGPSNYTFRKGEDVVRSCDIPGDFTAVLAGHIHRSQILTRDLQHRKLPAPVIYPGSIERTAFAERFEEKHYAVVTIDNSSGKEAPRVDTEFVPLPARPMITLDLHADDKDGKGMLEQIDQTLSGIDSDSVVRLRISGELSPAACALLSAEGIREIAPKTMNVSLRFADSREQ